MDKQLETIEEYYTNLYYKSDDTEFVDKEIDSKCFPKMVTTSKEIKKHMCVNEISRRFRQLAHTVEENFSFFNLHLYNHSDNVTGLINYLNYFSAKLLLDNEEYENHDIILLLKFTLQTMFQIDRWIHHGVETCFSSIFEDVSISRTHRYFELQNRPVVGEIIILADSDLYAVINFLKRNILYYDFNKIWIQHPIYKKFVWLLRKFVASFTSIDCIKPFHMKKELFTSSIPNKINIVSIWTEDIVFAKNLAMSLDRDIIFINTYMDCGATILFPYTKVCIPTKYQCKSDFDDYIKDELIEEKDTIYTLYYDGMWQQPIRETYWIENDCQWANATSADVNKCIDSAEKGFKIWSNESITTRSQILTKLGFILQKVNIKNTLHSITIEKWLRFIKFDENCVSCLHNREMEVVEKRKPRGVIILKEKNPTTLFERLIEILIAGNSVIVISDVNASSLVSYYDVFMSAKIPKGVVNLLLSKNLEKLELSLCGMDYESYAKQFFSGDSMKKTYLNLTKPKQIILPLN